MLQHTRRPVRPLAYAGWTLFALCGGRVISYVVCTAVDTVSLSLAGPPDIKTPSGITQLWSRHYHLIPYLEPEPWTLLDGTRLGLGVPVFEVHLSTPAMRRARGTGRSVEEIDRAETLELAKLLRDRHEVALVGRGIFRARLSSMGWSIRETPPGIHRSCDTFTRKLYLLAARGPKRAARDEGPVAEVAISLRDFIARAEAIARLPAA